MKLSNLTEAGNNRNGMQRGSTMFKNIYNALITKIQSSLEDKEGLARQSPWKEFVQAAGKLSNRINSDADDVIDWWVDILEKLDMHPKIHKQLRERVLSKVKQNINEGFLDSLAKSLDLLDPDKRKVLTQKYRLAQLNSRMAIMIIKELLKPDYMKFKTDNVEKFLAKKNGKPAEAESKSEPAEAAQETAE